MPFWTAIALVLFAFKTGDTLRQQQIPAVDDPARLIAAAGSLAQRSQTSSRSWGTATEALYDRVVQVQPRNVFVREQLISMHWGRYQTSLFLNRRSSKPDLAEILRLSSVPGFMSRPKGDTYLIEVLAEIELSRSAPDVSQAWRWLDKAEETIDAYSRDLLEMGGGPNRLADLQYLTGRARLQRYLLGRDPNDLKQATRSFWAATALAPASIANRYYLACSLELEGQHKIATRIASSVVRMKNSPRQSLEGPSFIYRRRINEVLSARKELGAPR